jgi:hypothetical protein
LFFEGVYDFDDTDTDGNKEKREVFYNGTGEGFDPMVEGWMKMKQDEHRGKSP